jgi:hypothetical protein
MESAWLRFHDRLTQYGLAWLWRRLRFEWFTPATQAGRAWLGARLRFRDVCRRIARPAATGDGALHAFYDLQVSPVTFDVLWFVAGAELRRRALGLDRIDVAIVPGTHGGLRAEDPAYENVVDAAERRRRVDQVLIPAFALCPSVAGARVLADRGEARPLRHAARHVYPALYDPALPVSHEPREALAAARRGEFVRCLRAPDAARAWIADWAAREAGGRRLGTVTLRQYGYRAGRNSDVPEWGRFARGLDPALYAVCVVPDTAESGNPPPEELRGCLYLPQASRDVGVRMALYDAAFANLGVNCGPLLLPLFAERAIRCVMFKMLPADAAPDYVAHMRALGFPENVQPPILRAGQKWVWEPDTYSVIAREFQALVAEAETGRA